MSGQEALSYMAEPLVLLNMVMYKYVSGAGSGEPQRELRKLLFRLVDLAALLCYTSYVHSLTD